MTYWTALLIGLIFGAAGFLPVSASGHLSFLHNLLRIGDLPEHPLFDALLRLAACAAVMLTSRKELRALRRETLAMTGLRALPRGRRPDRPMRRMIQLLLLAALPLIAAAILRSVVRPLYENTFFVGFLFLADGLALFLADHYGHGNKNERGMTLSDALGVGTAQMLAVVPGVSRTGFGISAGMLFGLDRSFAVRFSLLLCIPALLGGSILSLASAISAGVDWALVPAYLCGAAAAFVFGCLAVSALRLAVLRGRAGSFCYYCWGAGLLTLILSLIS